MIVYNAIKCNKCNEIIQSKHSHDFVMCSCNTCGVDGGISYLRRIGSEYIDLSLYSDSPHKDIREVMTWGKNYDENKNLLPKTEWVLIKDITNDHLEALLIYPAIQGKEVLDIFKNELQYRKDNNL